MSHPIYDAEPLEKLKDLKKAVEMAIEMIETDRMVEVTGSKGDSVSPGYMDEFFVGNWIVRPRFRIYRG